MRPRSIFTPFVTAALVALGLPGCGGGDDGGTSGPPGSIQITVAPAAVTIAQGTAGSVTLTLTRAGGFTGDVTLAAEGLPTGVGFASVPPTLGSTTTSATVTFTAAATAAIGTASATIRATGTGVTAATATVAVTITAAPNFTLTLNPTTLPLQAGTTGAVAVTITRTNFTAAVAVTVESPVAGITGVSNPTSVADGNAVVTITVGAAVPVGTYTLTVKGTAAPVGDRTATLAVTVTAPPPLPNFTLAVTPAALSLDQGTSGTVTVAIARTNFTGAVTLSLDAPPTGIGGTFNPNGTMGNTSALTLTIAPTVAVGTHTLTIRGTDGGLLVRTVTLALTVTAVSGSLVEFQFCSSSENPVFLAYQDGAGAWATVSATLSGGVYRYSFTLGQRFGGVFFVQTSGSTNSIARAARALEPTGRVLPDASAVTRPGLRPSAVAAVDQYETTVFYGMAADLASAGLDACAGSQATRTVWLQVLGIGNGQQATLSLGGVTNTFIGGFDQSPVEFSDVRNGVIDFFGSRESILTGVPGRLLDVRNLNPADGSTLPFTADFNSAAAYDPAAAQLTIANALGDDLLNFTSFYTTNGAVGDLNGGMAPSAAVTRTWYGVPSVKLQAGDVHANTVLAFPAAGTGNEARFLSSYLTTVQNAGVTLGARLPTPTVTSIGVPAYRRLRVQGGLPDEYSDLVFVTFGPSGGDGNDVQVAVTGGYLIATDSETAYDLRIPDLTALTGFPLASGLPAGEIETMVTASGWNGTGILEPVPANGTLLLGALKEVKTVVP